MFKVCASVAVIAVGMLCSAGRADFGVSFSFASDTNENGPTFMGQGFEITDGGDVFVDFLVDDNLHDPGGVTEFEDSLFEFDATAFEYGRMPVHDMWLHAWLVMGDFSFGDGSLLDTDFEFAFLTSVSPNEDTLGPTMTLQGAEATDPAIQFVAGAGLNGIGIYSSDLVAQEAFAFTFTAISKIQGQGLPQIDPQTGEFVDPWEAEGSYSAFATVPGPAALSVISLGLVITGVRRRRG